MIEIAEGNSSTHRPRLSGGVATLAALREVEREVSDAIRLDVKGLRADGPVVPPVPTTIAEYMSMPKRGRHQ
jgi:hypothetical protein